jgi:hypothetical protein
VAAQLAEQLLQVGQGDLLALTDGSQRNRPVGGPQGQIDHRRDGETAFGGQTHVNLLSTRLAIGLPHHAAAPLNSGLAGPPPQAGEGSTLGLSRVFWSIIYEAESFSRD